MNPHEVEVEHPTPELNGPPSYFKHIPVVERHPVHG